MPLSDNKPRKESELGGAVCPRLCFHTSDREIMQPEEGDAAPNLKSEVRRRRYRETQQSGELMLRFFQ